MRDVWPDAKRGLGQARSAGEVPDVDGTPLWVECKRYRVCSTRFLQKALKKAEEEAAGRRPVVVIYKEDRGPIFVVELQGEQLMYQYFDEWLIQHKLIAMCWPSIRRGRRDAPAW